MPFPSAPVMRDTAPAAPPGHLNAFSQCRQCMMKRFTIKLKFNAVISVTVAYLGPWKVGLNLRRGKNISEGSLVGVVVKFSIAKILIPIPKGDHSLMVPLNMPLRGHS